MLRLFVLSYVLTALLLLGATCPGAHAQLNLPVAEDSESLPSVTVSFFEQFDNRSMFTGTIVSFVDITNSIRVRHEGVSKYMKGVCRIPSSNDDMVLHATLYYYVYDDGHIWGELCLRNDSMEHANGAVFGDMYVLSSGKVFSVKGGKLWDQTGWVMTFGKPRLAFAEGVIEKLSQQWPVNPLEPMPSSMYWMGYTDVRGEQHNAHHMRTTGTPFGSDELFEVFVAWLYNVKYPHEDGNDVVRPLLQNVYETIGYSARALYYNEVREEPDDLVQQVRFLPNRPSLLSRYGDDGDTHSIHHYQNKYTFDFDKPTYAKLGEAGIYDDWDRHRSAESFGRRGLEVVNAWDNAEEIIDRPLIVSPANKSEKPWYFKAVRDSWPETFTGKLANGWRYQGENERYPGFGRSFFDPGHFNLITRFCSAVACTPSQIASELVHNHCHWALEPAGGWDGEDVAPHIRGSDWSYRTRGWPVLGFLNAHLVTGDPLYLQASRRILAASEMGRMQGGAVNLSDPEGKRLIDGGAVPAQYLWFKAWQLSRWVSACRVGSLVDPDEMWRGRWRDQGVKCARAMALAYVPGTGWSEWIGFPWGSPDPVLDGVQPGVTYLQAGDVMFNGTRAWAYNGFAWADEVTDGEFSYVEDSWGQLQDSNSYPRYLWADRSVTRWNLFTVRRWGHDGDLLE